ncbi:hypothetical protein SAMN06298216_4308 [Spirosomataceae bacterium TFI 002]|nr:hypothetical protein SAMN06298216_4308 [Spirosomataceae bacterium TFI 002]
MKTEKTFSKPEKVKPRYLKSYHFSIILILLNVGLAFTSSAEGTRQVSPSESKIAALHFSVSSNLGSGFNASQEDRIYFHISNHQTENFYFGARVMTAGSGSNLSDVYYCIKDSLGNLVSPRTKFISNISSYDQAVAGPNINASNPSGYAPIVFDPTINGNFYIEFYRSSTAGVTNNLTSNFIAPWFDFTVGEASGVFKPGRVYCENWSFITAKSTANFSGTYEDKLDLEMFTYTDDEVVIKVIFKDIQPLGFFAAFNSYGVDPNETDWLIGRKSKYSGTVAPQLINSYKTFLVEPDALVYPSSSLASPPSVATNIIGCPGNYLIPFNSDVVGDVKFVLDINGISGFQENTKDLVLEAINVEIGLNYLPWDGLDGLGIPVSQNTEVKTIISILRGRVNLPLFDAEINPNGISFEMVRPASVPNLKMYWDDSELTIVTGKGSNINNTTGPGINNSEIGQLSPGHAWNGPYGNSLINPPALANGGGSATPTLGDDDFGNVRTINTWFWGLEEKSGNLSFRIPYCNEVSGSLINDLDGSVNGNPISIANNIFILLVDSVNIVSQVVRTDSNGFFTFTGVDSGNYSLILSDTPTEINTQAPPPYSLPLDWVLIGEGVINGNDGSPNGQILFSLSDSDLGGLAFGLQKKPDSNSETFVLKNTNGSNRIKLKSLIGFDLEDGELGAGSTIKIITLPTNGKLYYDGIELSASDLITGYNPDLLRIDPDFDHAGSLSFTYSFIDSHDLESSIPATIIIQMDCQSVICVPIDISKN